MSSSQEEHKMNRKDKIQTLLNKGVFDSHLPEISKALYTKRIFSKDLTCFINEKNFPNLIKSLTPRNKIIKNSRSKKHLNDINLYELNKHKEGDFKASLLNIVNSIKYFSGDHVSKFKELKKDNDSFIHSFDAYKELNKKKDSKKDRKIVNDLYLNYKFKKSISLDQQNLLDSDVLKESPLSTKKYENLHFYYIINRNEQKNENKNNNLKKINELKEPTIWSAEKMDNLKELKYLKKIDKITKNKMRKGNLINNNDYNYDSDSNDDDNNKNNNNNLIKSKEDYNKIKSEIIKEQNEINKLKNTIKKTLNENLKNKNFSKLRLNFYNYIPGNLKYNSYDKENAKGQTFFINKSNLNSPEFVNNIKNNAFSSTMNKDTLFKSNSENALKILNDQKLINYSVYSKDSLSNIFQHSTYYSNSGKQNSTLNQISFNNNLSNLTRKENKNETSRLKLTFNNNFLKRLSIKGKLKRQTVFINNNLNHNSFNEPEKKLSIENVYSMAKNIENNKKAKKRKESLNAINEFIGAKTKDGFNANKKYSMKDTFFFFHKVKKKIKSEDIKFQFRKLQKFTKKRYDDKLKYLDILDNDLFKKEKEFLNRVLHKK